MKSDSVRLIELDFVEKKKDKCKFLHIEEICKTLQ